MRFVTPEVERITLDNGDWIEVKKELTVGEEKRFRAAGFRQMTTNEQVPSIDVDWARLAIARVEAYLVDWSATRDVKGKTTPVKVSRETIEALDQADFERIDDAVQQHIDVIAASKKATNGNGSSPPPSSS